MVDRVVLAAVIVIPLALSSAPAASSGPTRGPLEAAFGRESYRPGDQARLGIWNSPAQITVQILRTGPERERTGRNDEMKGIPVTPPMLHRAPRVVPVRIGDWAP